MKTIALLIFSLFSLPVFASLDTNRIQQVIGIKGAWNAAEGVYKVTVPRTDVKITVDSWTMPPFMGLASWASFTKQEADATMVMGDTVLLQDEVNPVMSVALENGLSVTALHNHFFYDEPKVYFMHISGNGDTARLAAAVRQMWDRIKAVRAAHPQPMSSFGLAAMPATNAITGQTITNILGTKGQANNGMFKVVIGRTTKMSCGCEMTKDMGVNTWAAFAGTDDNALVDGDFAVHEDELQPVLKSLRHSGVNIVAIHSHMTDENPRTLFLHYWGRGSAADLARALKTALDIQTK
jgi:hypothetical protein